MNVTKNQFRKYLGNAGLVKQFVLLVSLSFLSTAMQAQPVKAVPAVQGYTLAQLWDSVTQNAKVVNIARLRLLSATEQTADIKQARLPDISVSAAYTKLSNLLQYEDGLFSQPTRFPISHTGYNLGTAAYFNLYAGHRSNRALQQAKINQDIQNQQVQLTLSETKLLVAAYYLDLIRDQKFLELLQQDIAEQKKVVLQITAFYKSGLVLKSDVLRAELKISKQVLQLHQISHALVLTTQKINLLTGSAETQLIKPVDTIDTIAAAPESYESYVQTALTNAYELRIGARQQIIAVIGLKDAQANILPQLGLYADYGLNYPQGRFYPYVLSLYGLGTAGIKATYPLSALYKNRHKVTQARLAIREQELEYNRTADELKNQTRASYLALQEDLENISLSRSNIVQTTENLRILKNSYFNQTALLTDYLDADLQLLQARFDLSAAQVAAAFHRYQLKKILGQL